MKVSFADFLFERFTNVLLVWGIAVEMDVINLLILAMILLFGVYFYVWLFVYAYFRFIH